MGFFELRTSRDRLDESRCEYARSSGPFDIDNLFYFFAIASHIKQGVRVSASSLSPSFEKQ